MYHSRSRFIRANARPIMVSRRAGLRGVVGDDSDELSEVAVTARLRATPPPTYPPTEYDQNLQEIVVSGMSIPWWMWGIGGVLAAALIFKVAK